MTLLAGLEDYLKPLEIVVVRGETADARRWASRWAPRTLRRA